MEIEKRAAPWKWRWWLGEAQAAPRTARVAIARLRRYGAASLPLLLELELIARISAPLPARRWTFAAAQNLRTSTALDEEAQRGQGPPQRPRPLPNERAPLPPGGRARTSRRTTVVLTASRRRAAAPAGRAARPARRAAGRIASASSSRRSSASCASSRATSTAAPSATRCCGDAFRLGAARLTSAQQQQRELLEVARAQITRDHPMLLQQSRQLLELLSSVTTEAEPAAPVVRWTEDNPPPPPPRPEEEARTVAPLIEF